MEALIYFPLALPQKNAIAKRYVHIWVELEAADVIVIRNFQNINTLLS